MHYSDDKFLDCNCHLAPVILLIDVLLREFSTIPMNHLLLMLLLRLLLHWISHTNCFPQDTSKPIRSLIFFPPLRDQFLPEISTVSVHVLSTFQLGIPYAFSQSAPYTSNTLSINVKLFYCFSSCSCLNFLFSLSVKATKCEHLNFCCATDSSYWYYVLYFLLFLPPLSF